MAITHLVPRESTDGSRFFVSADALEAFKILPNGCMVPVRATPTTCPNCKVRGNANRKQRYLQFKDAFGRGRHILASHAVCLAWNGPRPTEPDGRPFECHHLNGITTDNRHTNLIWLSHHDHVLYDRALRHSPSHPRLAPFSHRALRGYV